MASIVIDLHDYNVAILVFADAWLDDFASDFIVART